MKRRGNGQPIVSVYEIEDSAFDTLRVLHFASADVEWLRYVASNRKGKYGMEPMEATRSFLTSQTHAMLEDAEYAMRDFSERAIFDMWEAERVTGDPRNSIYLRGE